MMITTPDGMGHFAIIDNGRNAANTVQKRRKPVTSSSTYRDFEETIPTDFGGLSERRHYTPKSMRAGLLLLIASALVSALAFVVIVSESGRPDTVPKIVTSIAVSEDELDAIRITLAALG